jgi:histidyl-tRNA synthetase
MGKSYQSVKGMRDLLPPETALWAAVEATARRVFASYGYGEIRTPILEDTELFVRGVGASTDIVGKEMFTFVRSEQSLTLRPESTAAVARAFVEHRLADRGLPAKLFYIGPQFRAERPQKGRYRQFNQIGAELIGDAGPLSDAEVLLMLVAFLGEVGLGELTVLLNTVGDEPSRAAYRERLREFLRPHYDQLGEDSRRRFETNPLRILDTKNPAEREILAGAPRLADSLNEESREHFAAVLAVLDRFGVRYRVDDRLVRGLDYYTRTVFEIVAEGLGSQNAVCGGGRYDGLIAELGGPSLPGIGFAIGEDRLLDVVPEAFRLAVAPRPPAVIAAAGGVPAAEALALAEELRRGGLAVVAELAGKSLKAAFKQAERLGARHLVLLGDEELAAGQVTIKTLATGEQRRVARAHVAADLAE